MNKAGFIDKLSEQSGMSKTDASHAVEAVLETIRRELSSGEEIAFAGFGKFHVATRHAREGVHPRTGERISIPASKTPKFSAGSGLKRSVNS
ncbi:MAG: DNA-binding protein [Actinobacteria bacterium]|uniref:Unannotated protein n=1 Tax=freshwater metagenome TaxID=449393 RepID=A0A6J5ZTZ9_9ZZZZ|nr:DNA-binding protein [Actinomycetota bacterium]